MTNISPKITIIMSVFNGERYLKPCLDSIIAQTYTHFELIVVDDGSTDNTKSILLEYAKQDARINIKQQQHKGLSASLNLALKSAQTQWVARCDADDIMYPNRIELQLGFLKKNPSVRLTCCMAEYIGDTGNVIGRTINFIPNQAALQKRLSKVALIPLVHPCVMVDREIALVVGGYRQQFLVAEDIDLWTRIAEMGVNILVMDKVLMKFRMQSKSTSSSNMYQTLKMEHWVQACALARHHNKSEPSLEQFQQSQKALPIIQKLNYFLLDHARVYYKIAGINYLSHYYFSFIINLTIAMLCAPHYVLPRLKQQIFAKK